ncbi:MAG: hypothetical protein WC621_01435 [Patescibacteria group bacterium]
MISASLGEFVKQYPGMVWYNLRVEQRPHGQPRPKWRPYQDSDDVCEEIHRFLRALPKGSKIALHFQGYGTKVGTAVVQVENVYWTSDGYPRLDFKHPKGFEKINGCPNFWGAFILAIALVMPEVECFAQADPDAAEFKSLADRFVQLIEYSYEYRVELVTKSEAVGNGGIRREEKILESVSLGNLKIEGAVPRDSAWLQITCEYWFNIGTFNFRIMKVDDINKIVYIHASNLKNAKILKTRCSTRV